MSDSADFHYDGGKGTAAEWRPIPGLPNYEASSDGQIRSLDHVDPRGRRRRGRVLKQTRAGRGGKYFYVPVPGKAGSVAAVHRLVLMAFRGPCPEGMEACHNNGDGHDNRIENLRWGSHASNVADMMRHKREARERGRHGREMRTAQFVDEVRRLLDMGFDDVYLYRCLRDQAGLKDQQIFNLLGAGHDAKDRRDYRRGLDMVWQKWLNDEQESRLLKADDGRV